MNRIDTGSLPVYVLLLTLTVVLTVLVPAAIVGWWRGRRARAEALQARREFFSACPVCHHSAGVHDTARHHARGIPIPDRRPTINLGRSVHHRGW